VYTTPDYGITYSSLVVSDGVDCGRRRQNVYDKKPKTTEQRV